MSDSCEYRVLLVEDDRELAAMVADFLTPHGFVVRFEGRGDRAVERLAEETFDVLILDLNLPGLDGYSICRTVRPTFAGTIVILTARDDEVDEVVGLEVGADDYMRKPVRPRALLARLRAHLRKPPPIDPDASAKWIAVGDLMIDTSRRVVELGDRSIDLTTTEFDLLWLLAERVGEVVSRNEIYQKLNDVDYDGLDRSIDLRVSRLRKKLDDDPKHPDRIKSIRGVGYLLSSDQ